MTMNSENLDIPQPDPAWDYYVLWHSLNHVKAKIESALEIIQHIECATLGTNSEVLRIVQPACNDLVKIIYELASSDDDDDDDDD